VRGDEAERLVCQAALSDDPVVVLFGPILARQRLTLPVVILNDDDGIAIGSHRMRFSSLHPGERI
jgi:hypothetical protein